MLDSLSNIDGVKSFDKKANLLTTIVQQIIVILNFILFVLFQMS